MRKLLEVIAFLLMLVAVLALFFLFSGSPDLWDKLHERAMSGSECVASKAGTNGTP